MTDHTRLPPPPAPIDTAADDRSGSSARSHRLPHPVGLFGAAAAAASAAGGLIGTAVGAAVASSGTAGCSPSDGWCELGAVLLGFVAGVVAGVVAYVTVGVIVIRRCRPAGARAGHVVAHLAFPAVAVAVLSILSAVVP